MTDTVSRKRKSPPPIDALSRSDKEQKRQHVITEQDIHTPSADEESHSQILDANKDSILCDDLNVRGIKDSPSAGLPKYLDPSQRTYSPI
jgi:hypothetical protein